MATVEHAGHALPLPHTGDVPGRHPALPRLPGVNPGRDQRPRGELEDAEVERAGGVGGVGVAGLL